MKLIEPKNIFYSFKFCDIFAKVFGIQFISIRKDKLGNYFAKTSQFDILRAFIAILYGIWMLKSMAETTMELNSGRSLIFEITTVLNSKFHGDHCFIMFFMYLTFHKCYFKILKNIHEIDEKVNDFKVFPSTDFYFLKFYISKFYSFLALTFWYSSKLQ